MILIAAAPSAAVGSTGWAHQATGFQSNGAVTVKSLSGGANAGTLNPTGAVAKVNQNAATQGPTVIIQATGANYSQAYPMVVVGSATIPTCPTGYNSIWSAFAPAGSNVNSFNKPIYNVGGSRFTFGAGYNSGSYYVTFFADGVPATDFGGSTYNVFAPGAFFGNGGATNSWAANLCTK